MGVMSRRVLPVCGNFCFFCPSLRARSRQPVKRYKKMLAEIFPRNQEAEPNDRKICKLCEYASRNPLRIPKITDYLEQRCYKDLRYKNIGSVKAVLCVYKKFLSSCKEHMPLYSSSLLSIVRALLEQAQQGEVQIMGCITLVDFISCQTGSTHMFNLEGLIPKLFQLAQVVGDNERTLRLRSAGMQALAFMVSFMGEHSQVSMDFDLIISAILENYPDLQENQQCIKENGQNSQTMNQRVQGVYNNKENGSSFPSMSRSVSFRPHLMTGNDLENMDTLRSPSYWSMVCLCNIARLAKETTTVRRVLEPLFHAFDSENYWSPQKGVAASILLFLQSLLEESGENCHPLISTLIKHLDHKNVSKQPILQLNIVNVTTYLAQNAKQRASVTITSAIADLIRHLRKCLQSEAESVALADEMKQNSELQRALQKCIAKLSNKVGDVGPILDVFAVVLENISTNVVIARTTASAVLQAAHVVLVVPNISYYKKVFPDALFHQLLLGMAHADSETRVAAHNIFSIVLLQSLLLPWLDEDKKTSTAVSGTVSINGAQKLRMKNLSFQCEGKTEESSNGELHKEGNLTSVSSMTESTRSQFSCHTLDSFKDVADGRKALSSIRLSSHQVNLLLSSIWVQATYAENTPADFEAMAHTYNITLLSTRAKTSSHMALVRCFQLAFSLRNLTLDQDGGMELSRRKSLFTFASYMLIFAAAVGHILDLIPIVKASLTDKRIDPYLELEGDMRLRAASVEFSKERMVTYGSAEDDIAAFEAFLSTESDDCRLKEIVISHFTVKPKILSEDDSSNIREQILSEFSPDDAYPFGAPCFMETPGPGSPLPQAELPAFEEAELSVIMTDEETSPEANGSQSGRRTSLSTNTPDILSVNQLLESVSETARQVASFPISSAPIPYDQMMSQCEALVTDKQQKMLVLQSFKLREAQAMMISDAEENNTLFLLEEKPDAPKKALKPSTVAPIQPHSQLSLCLREHGQNSFRLPPSSPYDRFLKAAGC